MVYREYGIASPSYVTNLGNEAEVPIPAEHRQAVLEGQSSDPNVVFGNGHPSGLQPKTDHGVVDGGCTVY